MLMATLDIQRGFKLREETMDGQQIGSVHNFEATGVLRVPVSALCVSPRGSAWPTWGGRKCCPYSPSPYS